jgi:phosphatidylethanolamine/phosphatidyl-N-methylethanolamine N-methyltransferase
MKMTNRRNRIIYKLWAPVYDQTVDRFFLPGRKAALQLLDLRPGESVLLVGVGTGADLPFLPEGVNAVCVDLSPEMLERARCKLPLANRSVVLLQGDAQSLLVQGSAFDAILFNLILSVIPDGSLCLHENLRALKPSGRVVVFDKFAPEGGRISIFRQILNFFSTLFGTAINRCFGEMLQGSGIQILQQRPSILGGMYKIFLLKKEF